MSQRGELREYERGVWDEFDTSLIDAADYSSEGDARWSSKFVVAPSAFNAISAHAAAELYRLTADEKWNRRAKELGGALDDQLWDDTSGLFADLPIVGGGRSTCVPTLDGVLGALSTNSPARARRALDQLNDPSRFAAPFGPRYLPRDHALYRPDKYWRGPAWPQLNYLILLSCRRWQEHGLAEEVAEATRRGVRRADFAEYWNPETGEALAMGRQSWSAIVAAMY